MSLKELTKDSHTSAEATKFMQAVMKREMPENIWADYTYNKMLWYGAIETKARADGLLNDLPGIERSYALYQDAKEMFNGNFPKFKQTAIDYQRYILDLPPGKVAGHLYTWHMGDLFGGQMIKKMLPPPHRNLDFPDVEGLKVAIRSKLGDDLANEANIAFDWAIKIMNEYDSSLG